MRFDFILQAMGLCCVRCRYQVPALIMGSTSDRGTLLPPLNFHNLFLVNKTNGIGKIYAARSPSCIYCTNAFVRLRSSWWWAERLPEMCRVITQITKLELSASVGSIHKESITMHGHTTLKFHNLVTTELHIRKSSLVVDLTRISRYGQSKGQLQ